MRRCLFFLMFFCSVFVWGGSSPLQEPVYKVGLVSFKPFSWIQQGKAKGYAVHLWEEVSRNLDISYEYVPFGTNIGQAIQGLQNGSIDFLVGPISITVSRNDLIDYSVPFLINYVGGVAKSESKSFLKMMFSVRFLSILEIIGLFFMLAIIYSFLHKGLTTEKNTSFFNSIYVIVSNSMNLDPLFKKAKNSKQFFLSVSWVFLSLIMVSLVTSLFVSTITEQKMIKNKAETKSVRAVRKEQVGVVRGTSTISMLHDLGIPKAHINLFPGAEEMLDALKTKKIQTAFLDLSVYDGYRDMQNQKTLMVNNLKRFDYLALAGSKKHILLMKKISTELLKLQDKGLLTAYCKMYFNDKKKFCLPFVI